MCLNAADRMEIYVILPDDPILKESPKVRLDSWRYQRKAIFGMPRDMKIDLSV